MGCAEILQVLKLLKNLFSLKKTYTINVWLQKQQCCWKFSGMIYAKLWVRL